MTEIKGNASAALIIVALGAIVLGALGLINAVIGIKPLTAALKVNKTFLIAHIVGIVAWAAILVGGIGLLLKKLFGLWLGMFGSAIVVLYSLLFWIIIGFKTARFITVANIISLLVGIVLLVAMWVLKDQLAPESPEAEA